MRKHLVQKIIQTIFPTHDHNIYRDPRLSNLVNYAIKTECEMYEQAKDQEEYFHLLAERIYKIQKEFEDKQRMSKINQNQNPTTTNRVGTPSSSTTTTTTTNGVDLQQSQQQISNDLSCSVSGGGLSTFQTQLNPLNAYNPDLSAGNGGPPNKLAPLSDSSSSSSSSSSSMKKQPQLNRQASNLTQLDSFLTNQQQQQQHKLSSNSFNPQQQQQASLFNSNSLTIDPSSSSSSSSSQLIVDSFIKEENASAASLDIKPSNASLDMIGVGGGIKTEALEYNGNQFIKTEMVSIVISFRI
jgi:hypothetical protein